MNTSLGNVKHLLDRRENILAIILFRLCDGENSRDDDEHENEDDFSTSEL
jgi:hypothetical protein